MAKKRRSKGSAGSADVFVIDFSKEVEGGGGGTRVPENDYRLKILKAKKIRASEKDTPGIAVTVKIAEGKFEGKKITDRLWITPKSLWRIRSLLEALGMEVPKKALKIPVKKLIGQEVGATIIDDDPYNGRIRSKIGDWIDLETLADLDDEDEDEDDDELDEDEEDTDDEEDDEEEDEDEEDEDEDEDDLSEMDRKELKSYIKENDLDVKVTKKMDEAEIVEAIEEAQNEEDDDDDEDEDDLDLEEL